MNLTSFKDPLDQQYSKRWTANREKYEEGFEVFNPSVMIRQLRFEYLLFIVIVLVVACTDQGDPIKYSLSNTTNYTIEVIRYDRFGNHDTTLISQDDFEIMAEDVPPYDNGPFGVFDSLRIQFEDLKILTYKPPESELNCIDSIKNPFCQYGNYVCLNSICTFEIDNAEYQKAK